MLDPTENDLRDLQQPVTRGLDEMSQQTLDALKIVHSFESKPARSERIKEMLERKQSQRLEDTRKHSERPASSPVRCQPRAESREARETDSANTNADLLKTRIGSEQASVAHKAPEKQTSTPMRGAQELSGALKETESVLRAALPRLPKPSARKLEDAGISKFANLKTKRGPSKAGETSMATSAVPALRTKGSSATYSAMSRLMQPTAASVAKANTRILPKPASKGLVHSSYASSGQLKPINPGMLDNPPLGASAIRPSALTKAARSANTSMNTNVVGSLSKSKLPSLKPLSVTAVPPQPTFDLSTPVTKSYFKNAGIPALRNEHEVTTVNPSMLCLDNELNSPAKTSTPVRPLVTVPEQEHSSMHSIDYSNFSNFSYVADWAQTPELARKALEQRNVDTLRLFGSIPPVDIEAIFGSEIRKQQRQ